MERLCRISDLPDLLTKKAHIIQADTRRTVSRANWKFAEKSRGLKPKYTMKSQHKTCRIRMILVGQFGHFANGTGSGEYVFTSSRVKDLARFTRSQPHRQGMDDALIRYKT